MPLTASSHFYLHVSQSVLLILIAAFLVVPLTYVLIFALLSSPFLATTKRTNHRRTWRLQSSPAFRPRKVLVTGIGMAKGLAVARIFYRAGHDVIGADFEEEEIQFSFGGRCWNFGRLCLPGRWSRAVQRFYRLPDLKKEQRQGKLLDEEEQEELSENYIEKILHIIRDEEIDVWASVSSDKSAMEDAEAAELVEESSKGRCKAIQFGHTLTGTLHDKFSFIQNTRRIGLNVPDTHLVTSEAEAMSILYPETLSSSSSTSNSNLNLNQMVSEKESVKHQRRSSKTNASGSKKYIMKSINLDSANRSNMTLLPQGTFRETEAHIRRLNPTPFKPYVLQQFVRGREYCAHSLVIAGEIRAFVACPSKELLVHYTALPASSLLSLAMERYLRTYAQRTQDLSGEGGMTGHFSVDFLVEEGVALSALSKTDLVDEKEVDDLVDKLYPIECNPRANTAVLLFSDVADELAETYLSVMEGYDFGNVVNGKFDTKRVVYPLSATPGYFWVGHDLITLVLLPVLNLFLGRVDLKQVLSKWAEFLAHVKYWRDGVFEVWDPWPCWWMYVVYWPVRLALRLLEGRRGRWSRINLATGKLFGC